MCVYCFKEFTDPDLNMFLVQVSQGVVVEGEKTFLVSPVFVLLHDSVLVVGLVLL